MTSPRPTSIADPFPAYRQLYGTSPVRYALPMVGKAVAGHDDTVHAWALLRFADVSAALRDHETFSSDHTRMYRMTLKFTLLHDDPPRHTHLRRLVNKAFSPRRVAGLEPWITDISRSLLDAIGSGPADFMDAYAGQLPVKVIASLLGIQDSDYKRFRRWSVATTGAVGLPPEERAKSMTEMVTYFTETFTARKARTRTT